jgi:hypothetical protein
MKPTPQNSPKQRKSRSDDRVPRAEQSFPATDYHFQATAGETLSAPAKGASFARLDTFRDISAGFLKTETHRDSGAELALFALITAVSAWPIIQSMVWITRLVRDWPMSG